MVAVTPEIVDSPEDLATEQLVTGMTDLLVKAVRALGAAGEPETASRLAGKAWWVLKDWPRQAERVNGTMHYLARLEPGARAEAPAETASSDD